MSREAQKEDILSKWDTLPIKERDGLLQQVEDMGLYPKVMSINDVWESEAGLYPDTDDPRFTEKLLQKQEFAENKQDSIEKQVEDGVNPCDPDREFELTPVQRFIGRFLSPQCPYQSALLYHGVGVGKTCAAINVAENYLASFPRKQVIIVCPRNIQPGFRRTIFDDEALKIPEQDSTPNTAKGCTGNTYLRRTGSEFEKDKDVIARRVSHSINSRYLFMGYIQFHRMIEDIIVRGVAKGVDEETAARQRDRVLRREFSGRLVIIDEAHNLRDNPGESKDDDADNPGGSKELTDSQEGKKLTPTLMKVLNAADGMKLLLMSGTPMYNSYREIIFLLNLLLMNDKRVTLSEADIFEPSGKFIKGAEGKKSGQELLGAAASAYVSFMRGENPLSFPVRLKPQGTAKMEAWPENSPDAKPISAEDRDRMKRLPFVPVEFEGNSMDEYLKISEEAIEAGSLSISSIDEMVQSGNWLFPNEGSVLFRDAGFDNCFDEQGASSLSQFKARSDCKWLVADALGTASPKAKYVLKRAQKAKGLVFVYSRFIKSGALTLALALEANGYTPWGDRKPLLIDGIQDGLGRQCALCPRRESAHAGAGHKFVAAKYVLITGRANISPNNAKAIQASRAKTNMDGREVKIIIGSQVASEGIDFRFVREIYVFDSWFHLNKMEQVLGRGIRTCSHAIMPKEERNCTIYLLVNYFKGQDTETADLYMYRNAMGKAMQVGRVTRVLKEYALDCNLNRDAIIVAGLETQRHVDSQGGVREEVNINDTPFTNVCDWIETCEYKCANPVDIDLKNMDTSTYDDYAVRWREAELRKAIKKLFTEREQPVFQLEEILEQMSAVPQKAISGLLSEIIGNHSFVLQMPIGKTGRTIDGYIVYRNGYYMFQPDYLTDVRIPLALRVADMPVKRDMFDPTEMKVAALPGTVAEAEAKAEAQPVEASGAAEVSGAVPAAAPAGGFWKNVKEWAIDISGGKAPAKDIPEALQKAISERYTGDAEFRENDQLIMVNWLYDFINTGKYTDEKKAEYLGALSNALIAMVWDESLKANEQLELLESKDPVAIATAKSGGQIVSKDTVTAYRFVDVSTGELKYYCGSARCSEAVVRVFESNKEDSLNRIKADSSTTTPIYGFMVAKGKEGRLIFKTNERPVPPGTKPEKGSECSIVSTISIHIRMLKEIAKMIEDEGYPRFMLINEYLDEKAIRKGEEDKAKAEGKKAEKNVATVRTTQYARKGKHPFKTRTFENAIRACALKDIILRMIDFLQVKKDGKRCFYRPILALKSDHKGTK